MSRFAKGTVGARLAYLLTVVFAFQIGGLFPIAGLAAQAVAPPPNLTVLVVPFANPTNAGGEDVASRITTELKANLAGSGRVTVRWYRESDPGIRRAVDVDKTLTKEDLALPLDWERALRIGRAVGANYVVFGQVDGYSWDAQQGQVALQVSATTVNVDAGKPAPLGLNIKPAPARGATEGEMRLKAINQAAAEVAASIIGAAPAPTNGKTAPPEKRVRKNNTGKILGIIAAIALIAIAAGGGGGGGGGTAVSAITAATAEPTANAVVLTWACADTSYTSFTIYRAPDDGSVVATAARRGSRAISLTSGAWQKIGVVPRTVGLTFTDRAGSAGGPEIGKLYQYQIRPVKGSTEGRGAIATNRYTKGLAVGPGYPSAPAAPTVVAGPGYLSARLTWKANPEPFVQAYQVMRATAAAGPFTKIGEVAAGSPLTFDDNAGLQAGATYWYRLRVQVNSLNQYVNGLPTEFTPQTGALLPPTQLVAFPSQTAIRLEWTASADPAVTGYYVYRNNVRLGGDITGTTYNDTTANPGVSYTYTVRSHNASGQTSVPSDPVTARLQEPAARLTLAPSATSMNADGVSTVDLTAVASSDSGTPVPGTEVAFSTNRGTLLPKAGYTTRTVGATLYVTTNEQGRAVATLRSAVLQADATATVTATCAGASPATVTITMVAPKPGEATISAEPSSIVGNGTALADIQVHVLDLQGEPLAGGACTITTTLGTLQPKAGTDGVMQGAALLVHTDANGVGVGQLKSIAVTATRTATVRATVAGLTTTPSTTVTFEPPAVTTIQVAVADPTLPGDGLSSTTVTATVKDQTGGVMAGKLVTFAINPALGNLSPASGTTNAQGQVQVTLTSAGSVWGDATITATSGTATGTAQVKFLAPPMVSLAVTPSVVPAGGAGIEALVTATVRYETGEPVADDTRIRFAFGPDYVTTSPLKARIKAGYETALTKNGVCVSYVVSAVDVKADYVSDQIIGWNDRNNDGQRQGDEVEGAVTLHYTVAPASVDARAEPASIYANGQAVTKITATVFTAVPNPLMGGFMRVADGTQVTFNTDRGTFTQTGGASAAASTVNGTAQVYLRSSQEVGVAHVSAHAGTVGQGVAVSFTAPPAQTMVVTANPGGINANGTDTTQVTAQIATADGAPVTGQTVNFITDLGTLTPTSASTDGQGKASVTLRAGVIAGTATVTATASTVTGSVLVPIRTGNPAKMYATVHAPGYIAATNGFPSPAGVPVSNLISARITDANGNPVVDGTKVYFTTDIGSITAMSNTAGGLAQATILSCNFEEATTLATAGPGIASIMIASDTPTGPAKLDQPVHVVFCGEASRTNILTGYPTRLAMYTNGGATLDQTGGSDADQPNLVPAAGGKLRVHIELVDSNDNPLPNGTPVRFSVDFGQGSVSKTAATALAGGVGGGLVAYADAEFDIAHIGPSTASYTAFLAVARAEVPFITGYGVGGGQAFSVQQWVGAGQPATGEYLDPGDFPAGVRTINVEWSDNFGNHVQNGSTVTWSIVPDPAPSNVVVNITDTVTQTAGGISSTAIQVALIDPGQAGSFTLRALCGGVEVTQQFNVPAVPAP